MSSVLPFLTSEDEALWNDIVRNSKYHFHAPDDALSTSQAGGSAGSAGCNASKTAQEEDIHGEVADRAIIDKNDIVDSLHCELGDIDTVLSYHGDDANWYSADQISERLFGPESPCEISNFDSDSECGSKLDSGCDGLCRIMDSSSQFDANGGLTVRDKYAESRVYTHTRTLSRFISERTGTG